MHPHTLTIEMKSILLADDNPHILAGLTRRLEANHYNVLVASNGFDALKLALEEKPDLVILDVWMPVGIGFSVAERIREHQVNIPIIFLTASKTPGLSQAAQNLDAAAYVEKPYDPLQLLQLIETTLKKRSTHHTDKKQLQIV